MKSLFLMIAAAVSLFLSTPAGAEWQSHSHRSQDDVVLLVQYAAQAYGYSRHNGGQIYYENRNYRDRHYGDRYYRDRNYGNRHHRHYEGNRYGHQRRYHDRYHQDRRHYRRHDRHYRQY